MLTSQQQTLSRADRLRAQADIGGLHRKKVRQAFKAAINRVESEARCVPDDKDELGEKVMWRKRFGEALVSNHVHGGCVDNELL